MPTTLRGSDNFDSASQKPIAEYEVTGSAVTSIDFTGLDINAHKSYRIELEAIDGATGSDISLYVNGDTTATNYYHQYIYANGASVSSGRANNPTVVAIISGTNSSSVINVLRVNGYPHILSLINRSGSSTIELIQRTIQKTGTVTNITQLTFTSNVANGIGVGTKVRIYRGDV